MNPSLVSGNGKEQPPTEAELFEARELWKESEWMLNLLRTDDGMVQRKWSDKEILKWARTTYHWQEQH